MAGGSLLTLLDDIATVLDDVAAMSKVAVKKTAGVLGDDLALNAEQVSGVKAEREIPVVWAVAKGSFINKLILVPAALMISAFIPWLITPLLILGGCFLCYEGFEKVFHKLFHKAEDQREKKEVVQAFHDPQVSMVDFEKNKIKGAIRTDFILSAEIIVIALGTVADSAFVTQVAVVSGIALGMTVFVYGLVAGIVKLDDAGLYLTANQGESFFSDVKRALGRGLLVFAPFLMKFLAIAGTIAMFLVGGGILVHGIPWLAAGLHSVEHWAASLQWLPEMLYWTVAVLVNFVVGLIAGSLLVPMMSGLSKLFKKNKEA
ncbi:MAG: DUF808 domain-containing protein [Gammaproteobacteria bacterium]|nr:DUF808 domain-containing protein [Gammaproteobacteria bacterium]